LDSYDYAALRTRALDPFGPGGSLRYQPASHDLATDEPLDPGSTAATINRKFTIIRGFYKFAVIDEHLSKDPTVAERPPRFHEEGQRRTFLTPLQFAAFSETAKITGPKEYAPAALFGMSGLRVAELCSLNVESTSVPIWAYRAGVLRQRREASGDPTPHPCQPCRDHLRWGAYCRADVPEPARPPDHGRQRDAVGEEARPYGPSGPGQPSAHTASGAPSAPLA